MSRRSFYAYGGSADDKSAALAARAATAAANAQVALQQAQLAFQAAQASGDFQAIARATADLNTAASSYEAAARVAAAQSGTPAKDPATVTPVLQVTSQPATATPSPITPFVQDHNYSPPSSGGMLDSLGQWVWVIPAGVVAVGLGYFLIKHRKGSVSGYRRRRSRR